MRKTVSGVVASIVLAAASLSAGGGASAATVSFRFFGPFAVAPYYPECANAVAVYDGGRGEARTVSFVTLPGHVPCDSGLSRPAGYLTADITQIFDANGGACAGSANQNGAGQNIIRAFDGCAIGGPGVVKFRTSSWYKYNGAWYLTTCRKLQANAAPQCPLGP
jgi:hypothetical protein